MPVIKRIHHLAIAVRELDSTLEFWQEALGLMLTERRHVPAESAEIAFFHLGEGEIELVRPTEAETGLARFLEKRGPGMHHICLEVEGLDELLENLKARGVRLINETPRQGENGRRYAFIHPESTGGVLVELYE
ncbi:MAG: methylmalonyl-CoA epimerase [Anaerolineales bacterium]